MLLFGTASSAGLSALSLPRTPLGDPGGVSFSNRMAREDSGRRFCYDFNVSQQRFKLSRVKGMDVDDESLLADLRRVASESEQRTIGQKQYRKVGAFDDSTVTRRFGTWNNALKAAGLELGNEIHLSDERLFENLLVLWTHLGRQPRRSELAGPPSEISQSPYLRRFRSWTAALEAFVAFANSSEIGQPIQAKNEPSGQEKPRTGRDPNLRLRFRVLQRDGFRCVQCGRTPATTPGVVLHIDHIVAWSRGGATVLENLQTLCESCNLGKLDR